MNPEVAVAVKGVALRVIVPAMPVVAAALIGCGSTRMYASNGEAALRYHSQAFVTMPRVAELLVPMCCWVSPFLAKLRLYGNVWQGICVCDYKAVR